MTNAPADRKNKVVLASSLRSGFVECEWFLRSLGHDIMPGLPQAEQSLSLLPNNRIEGVKAVVVVLWLDVDVEPDHTGDWPALRQLGATAEAARLERIPVHAFVAHPTLPAAERLQERVLTAVISEQDQVAESVRAFRALRMTLVRRHRAVVFRRREDLLDGLRNAVGSALATPS